MTVTQPEPLGLTPQQQTEYLSIGEEFRGAELAGGLILSEIYSEIWTLLDPARLPTEFMAAVIDVTGSLYSDALSASTFFLDEFRRVVGLPPIEAPERISVPRGWDVDTLVRDVRFDVLKRVNPKNPKSNRALAFSEGEKILQKRVLDGPRRLVHESAEPSLAEAPPDAGIVGWYRKTDGRPCHFCAMLASRGAVYSSRSAALVSSDETSDRYLDSYHPGCQCIAVPLYTTDPILPDLNRELQELWQEQIADLPATEKIRTWRSLINSRNESQGE